MAMAQLLKRMGRDDITVHGMRSTFRDWAAERTNYPNFVVEMALAHVVGDKVEAAYRRGDLLTKRKQLMDQWAKYCMTPKATDARGEAHALHTRSSHARPQSGNAGDDYGNFERAPRRIRPVPNGKWCHIDNAWKVIDGGKKG